MGKHEKPGSENKGSGNAGTRGKPESNKGGK
jgi:hypothetical protein